MAAAYAPPGECVFCDVLQSPPAQRKWYDEVLYSADGFSILPGLGAQAEGYVIVVPHSHVLSCAELSEAHFDALTSVLNRILGALGALYGRCIMFEHGSCGGYGRAGACIDHAHIHFLPIEESITELALDERRFTRLGACADLREWAGEPYLALRDQQGVLLAAGGAGAKGQYFRRLVGIATASPDDWDYVVFPHHDRIRATIRHVGPALASLLAGAA
jgi:diadenosine tetraphosphate (Ap4A) HIT family hydrolase